MVLPSDLNLNLQLWHDLFVIRPSREKYKKLWFYRIATMWLKTPHAGISFWHWKLCTRKGQLLVDWTLTRSLPVLLGHCSWNSFFLLVSHLWLSQLVADPAVGWHKPFFVITPFQQQPFSGGILKAPPANHQVYIYR